MHLVVQKYVPGKARTNSFNKKITIQLRNYKKKQLSSSVYPEVYPGRSIDLTGYIYSPGSTQQSDITSHLEDVCQL